MEVMSRRRFVATALGAAGLVGAGAMLGRHAFGPALAALETPEHELRVPGLPAGLRGLRIAQVTDVHLYEQAYGPGAERVVEAVHRLKPDVVVLTGDIVEQQRLLDVLTRFAADVRGTRATVATFGNWEYWGRIREAPLARAYERAGVQLLLNDTAAVHVDGGTLNLVGLDDPRAGFPDLDGALAKAGPADAAIWLVHAPAWVDTVPRTVPPPAAILAGHTHGGQVRLPVGPPLLLPKASGRFVSGWYRDTVAPLYVSRGVGASVLRARLNCPPEMPVFRLASA